jgi:tetratricopeptide (TPR) repeat protein
MQADVAARICAWAERLEELGRPDEARRVLREALDTADNPASIALMLSELEVGTGTTGLAGELLRKVLGDNPGNIPAVRMLARMLLDEGKADEAGSMAVEALSSIGQSSELAELVGEIRIAQGRYAEAYAAFGPRALLSSRGRRLRRRSWWRSGGPLRFRLHQSPTHTRAAVASKVALFPDPPSDAALETITWAKWLSGQDRHDDARQVISEALAAYGRQPRLLACAAGIEDAAGASNTALYLWREAYREAPDDVDVVCGLAMCLAFTLVKPSYTWRVRDALRVLDAFGDRSNPEIRTARAGVLRGNEASAARVVAAYGPTEGLPRAAARIRRRLWWRSAGLLGQLLVRVADRIADWRWPRAATGLVPRIEAESEAIARVLDSVGDLPPSSARERIDKALQGYGRQPSLLLACADVDAADGADWHGLAMAAEAARSSTGSLEAVCRLAWALDATYGYGTALQVLRSLSVTARQTVEARVLAGDLHRFAGNFTLAATGYGDPRDLDRYDRRSRRRCARRALAQRLRSAVDSDVDPIDPTSFDPVSPAIASVLDCGASLTDEPTKRRELTMAAIEEHGRHPLLLLELAAAERICSDWHSCAAAAEAMRRAPEDPLIVADAIKEVSFAGYGADAVRAIRDLSEQLADSPAVRRAAGQICRNWHLSGHAVLAFGRSGLEAQVWRMRRVCWWRSGGPMRGLRSSILTAESALLSAVSLPPLRAAALSALSLPVPVSDEVRGELSTYHMIRTHGTVVRLRVFAAWLDLIVLLISTVVAFTGLTLGELLRWPSAGTARGLTAAAVITLVEASAVWVVREITRRWVTRIGIAVACGVGAAFLLRVSGRLAFGAGLALAALAFAIAAAYLLRQIVRFASRVLVARWQRRQAETGALSALLDLLGELVVSQQRRGADGRRIWMADLEQVAITIDRDLPYALRSGDQGSQRAIAAHVRSAATALREMKEAIALPDAASRHELIERLTGLAEGLARGDFGNWPPPLREVSTARPLRPRGRQVMDASRTVLVIFTPALVAFVLPLLVPLSGPGWAWLRFASIVWALLGAVVALDPAWDERITKMRQGLDLLRSAGPAKSPGDSPALSSPADADSPPQIADAPQKPSPRSPRARTTPPRR